METFLIFAVIFLIITQAITFFLIFLLFRQFGEVYLSTGEGISRDGIPIGKKIPDFHVYSFNQKQLVHSESLLGKPTLLVFMSPRCKPCEELLPDWNSAWEAYHKKVNFVSVIHGSEKEVRLMLQKNTISGEPLWDHHKELLQSFRVRVTPFAFALNSDGTVIDKGLCVTREQIDMFVSSVLEGEKLHGDKENRVHV